MSHRKQLAIIGALVVISGLGAAVTADRAINGAINDMDKKPAQTAPESLNSEVRLDDSQQVQTVTTPDSVLQAQATQAPSDDVTQPLSTANEITEPSPETPAVPYQPHSTQATTTTESTVTFGQ
jgi:hypothetical protein